MNNLHLEGNETLSAVETTGVLNMYNCEDCGYNFDETELELGGCPECDTTNVTMIMPAVVVETHEDVQEVSNVAILVNTVPTREELQLVSNVTISRHYNHTLCQELMTLLSQTNDTQLNNILTAKEKELLLVFKMQGYNIKKTGEALGCTHTNVWQRLYGQERANAKGIIGKLRELTSNNNQQIA